MAGKNRTGIVVNIVLILVAIVYGYFLLKVTLFRGASYGLIANFETTGVRAVNFDPFIGFGKENPFTADVVKGHIKSEIYANLILLIPLGILFQTINRGRRAFLKSVAWVCLTSFFIELLQYIFALGIMDIDDLILNTAGGMIGAAIFVVMEKLSSYQTAKSIVAGAGLFMSVLIILMFFIGVKLPF